MDLLSPQRADELSTLLRSINVRSVVYCLSDLGAPWGFRVEGSAVAKFHLVLDGTARLSLAGDEEPLALSPGQLVLLMQGSAHTLRDDPDSPADQLERILADHPVDEAGRLRYGGAGVRTSLLCGGFALAADLPDDLFNALPPLLILDAARHGITRWLEPIFALMRDEVTAEAPGAGAVLAKIADVFLTQSLRTYLSVQDPTTVLVKAAATADPAIATALGAIRRHPGSAWTLARLAREAGMSRSAFTARFHELVGVPPMRYLARVRLGRAAGYLATSDKTLHEIARLVGYDNEASLSKAFRRSFGSAPGAFRREQLAVPGIQTELSMRDGQAGKS
jgi:AraC-like DNA-binding protein